MLSATLGATLWQPSWQSAALFLGILAATCFRWQVEPKPVRPASQNELDKLVAEMKALRGELNTVKMYFGLDTTKKKNTFSMFS